MSPPAPTIVQGSDGTYTATFHSTRLGLNLANDDTNRCLCVLSIDAAGPSANIAISRGDIILTVAGHSVKEDCTAIEACNMILYNERPLNLTFLKRKFAKARFQAMKDAEKAKKEAVRQAKVKLVQDAHDDQKSLQVGVARAVVDFEMDLSLISSTVKGLGGDPPPFSQGHSPADTAKA